jgi:hypothetical protein
MPNLFSSGLPEFTFALFCKLCQPAPLVLGVCIKNDKSFSLKRPEVMAKSRSIKHEGCRELAHGWASKTRNVQQDRSLRRAQTRRRQYRIIKLRHAARGFPQGGVVASAIVSECKTDVWLCLFPQGAYSSSIVKNLFDQI